MNESKITQTELFSMFGGSIPISVFNWLFYGAAENMPIHEVRERLVEMAKKFGPTKIMPGTRLAHDEIVSLMQSFAHYMGAPPDADPVSHFLKWHYEITEENKRHAMAEKEFGI